MKHRTGRAAYGNHGGHSYAVKLPMVDNTFLTLPFGRQLDALRAVKTWKETAKLVHIGAKRKATLGAVKRWIREHKPVAFYARWPSDSYMYKDDSVELYINP